VRMEEKENEEFFVLQSTALGVKDEAEVRSRQVATQRF